MPKKKLTPSTINEVPDVEMEAEPPALTEDENDVEMVQHIKPRELSSSK